jgi:hypothetical protein
MSSIQPSLKNKKNSSEILNWVHTTYNVNILKIEYLPKSAPTAANILTLLVWQRELSFDAKISTLFNLQYKHLHCQ